MSHHRQRSWWDCQPGPETLEVRRLPAQFGVPWHDPKHLSISFVPDGTPIAGHRSDLFATLDAREPTAVWQREILRAFQTWAVQAHVNFAVVPDDGEPLGTPGPDQHDPRFGDIRIGAHAMSPEVLSISVPHDPFLSGTWSGDVLLNSNVAFDDGGAGLLPAFLHEAGHVLGLDHSDDHSSVMSPDLNNSRVRLAPVDVAALQALYGPRPGDGFGGPDGNHTPRTAAPFPAPAGFDGSTPLLLYADVSTPHEADFFALTPPAGYDGPVTVRLQTSGVSFLAPHLTVLDAAGRVVADASSANDAGDTLVVKLPAGEPSSSYVIEVRGATDDVFGVGEYALAASFDARSTVSAATIDTLARQSYSYLSPSDINAIFLDPTGALFRDDHHSNDTLATAELLTPAGGYGAEGPDRLTASLGDSTDVDVYHVETPVATSSAPLVMTVTGRATEVNGLMPTVAVFDGSRKPVSCALVLAHGDGTYTIQVADAVPGDDYYLRVSADTSSVKIVGNYDLDVEYGHEAAVPTGFVAATLGGGGGDVQKFYTLVVNQTQLFDLVLAVNGDAKASGAGVRMAVTDASGRTVTVRRAGVGQSIGGDPLFLVPGSYRVVFYEEAGGGPTPPAVAYRLYGAGLTDPIGPALDDPTLNPVRVPTTAGPGPPGFPGIASPGDPYTWLAVTLAAPRTPSNVVSSAGTSVVIAGVSGNGLTPQASPFSTSPVAPAPLALRRANGTGSIAPTSTGRPTQPVLGRPGWIASLTTAVQAGFHAGYPTRDDVAEIIGPVQAVPRDDAAVLQPTRPSVASEDDPPPAPDPGPPGFELPSCEPARPPMISIAENAAEAPMGEASVRATLTPTVAIFGVFAVAYGRKRRLSVTHLDARLPFRRASAGVSTRRRSATADRVRTPLASDDVGP